MRHNRVSPAGIEQHANDLPPNAVAFQHAFIYANPNPPGSKDQLNRSPSSSTYSALHESVHPIVRHYLQEFGYYDIFLVDIDTGIVMYSVYKELDFATSLLDGSCAQSGLGQAFREARKLTRQSDVALIDFSSYWPSYDAPASFIASPIFRGSKKIGVAIFQMPLDRITQIMSERSGMGASGENLPRRS